MERLQTEWKEAPVRIAIGSGAAVFLMGAIFWAGATYNRVEGIETRLANIETQLSKLGDVQTTAAKAAENSRRIEQLDERLRQQELKVR